MNLQERRFLYPITVIFLFIFLSGNSLQAQNGGLEGTIPNYKVAPFLNAKKFEDLLVERMRKTNISSVLDFRSKATLSPGNIEHLKRVGLWEGTTFKRRYQERQWQHLLEESQETVLLEQALREQFGSAGFKNDLGYHRYHEDSSRRSQIIFLLSLPITTLYGYLTVAIVKLALNGSASKFTTGEIFSGLALGLGGAGLVTYHDYQRVQEYKERQVQSPDKNQKKQFEFHWKERW